MAGDESMSVAEIDTFARFEQLEKRISGSDTQGLRARWEFGKEMLADKAGPQWPTGYRKALADRIGVSQSELSQRVAFIEAYPREKDFFNALKIFASWHDWVTRKKMPAFSVLTPPMPEGVFATITADPPWPYENRATRAAVGTQKSYPAMSLEAICDLAPPAADDAHLYLWATSSFLREAFDVLDAWGFAYKTSLVWVKPQMGIGNYFRNSHELILFATRGRLPTLRRDERSWFQADRGRHSSKPEAFIALVERSSPPPYLELFARPGLLPPRKNWTVWGNEA
jgi:N6-adenosine-specific RNA methylase IME4